MQGGSDNVRPFEPWRLRGGGNLDARRRRLFALAAPVFRRFGYRGATIKALAHACGLRPASLYHYFESKADLATYLVRQPRMDWDSSWVDPAVDPVVQLAGLVDLAILELPNYLLALRLADEVGGSHAPVKLSESAFREGEHVFGRFVAATAPAMPPAGAKRVARDVLAAMVGSAVIGLDSEPTQAIRDRVVAVLHAALVPVHVDADRFESAMRD